MLNIKFLEMSRIYKTKKTFAFTNVPMLNSFELFYLRLFIHGLNPKEISEFLEIDQSTIYQIKKSIVTKYKTHDWVQIIAQSFKNKLLQKLDYLDVTVKEQALHYTQIIYSVLIEHNEINQQSELRQTILNFYLTTNSKLKNYYFKKQKNEKLNTKELLFLSFRYFKLSDEKIKKELNLISEKSLQRIRLSIFKKLETTNWFNTYKKAIQFSLIDLSNCTTTSINRELTNGTSKILRLKNIKRLSIPEIKLSIYNELLELYSSLELSKIICYDEDL